MKYLNNKLVIKDLEIEWCKIMDFDKREHFIFILTNGENKQQFNFTNSIMECELTNKIVSLKIYENFKKCIPKYWGGYDEVTNLVQLDLKRCEFLLYGFLNSLYNEYNIILDYTFIEFLEEFGFEARAKELEITYNNLKENKYKIDSLNLNSTQWNIFKLFGEEEEEEKIKKILEEVYKK